MARHAMQLLRREFKAGHHVCVELNISLARIAHRERYARPRDALYFFGKSIIDQMAPEGVAAFLFHLASFERVGLDREYREDGRYALFDLIEHLQTCHPHTLIIIDGVRGDMSVDAMVVDPYMGMDMVEPLVRDPAVMTFVRCRTANPSAAQLQHWRSADGMPLYREVARLAAEEWNDHGNVGITMQGATPATFDELYSVRNIVGPHMPILISGVRSETLTMAVRGAGRNFLIVTTAIDAMQGLNERIWDIIND